MTVGSPNYEQMFKGISRLLGVKVSNKAVLNLKTEREHISPLKTGTSQIATASVFHKWGYKMT